MENSQHITKVKAPFWLQLLYQSVSSRDEHLDVKQEVKTEFWKLSFLFAFFFFSCQRFTHWLPIWVRVQSVSPDMILTDCFFLHINSSLTQPPPYHQYNHHHHHSSVTVMHYDLRTYFDILISWNNLSLLSRKKMRPKMKF